MPGIRNTVPIVYISDELISFLNEAGIQCKRGKIGVTDFVELVEYEYLIAWSFVNANNKPYGKKVEICKKGLDLLRSNSDYLDMFESWWYLTKRSTRYDELYAGAAQFIIDLVKEESED